MVRALDRGDDLGVGVAVARQQPRALELQRERRQRVGEHVVHVAREPAALGDRGLAGGLRARLAQLLDERLGAVAVGAQPAHQPHDHEPRDDREQQPADVGAGLVAHDGGGGDDAGQRQARDGEPGPSGSRAAAITTTM